MIEFSKRIEGISEYYFSSKLRAVKSIITSRENIQNYTGDPSVESDKKYSKEMQKIRKEIRKLDKQTKSQGGVIDWNYMLNDMM